jgi:hypothetical protein
MIEPRDNTIAAVIAYRRRPILLGQKQPSLILGCDPEHLRRRSPHRRALADQRLQLLR